MPWLYHYTDLAGLKAILKSKVIKPSQVAIHGKGVYLTSMAPTNEDKEIILNNWDDGPIMFEAKSEHVKYYFKIESKNLPGVSEVKSDRSKDRDIWVYPGEIKLDQFMDTGKLRLGRNTLEGTSSDEYCDERVQQLSAIFFPGKGDL